MFPGGAKWTTIMDGKATKKMIEVCRDQLNDGCPIQARFWLEWGI
jgi:hypothetical protein